MSGHPSIHKQIDRFRKAAEWSQRLADPYERHDLYLEWQAWCRADPDNALAFEQVQQLYESLSPERVARVTARMKRKRPGFPIAVAATTLMVLGAASVWLYANSAGTQEWSTGIGEVRRQILADGSTLDLGADSRVVVRYSGSERLLELTKGRALFTVKHDPVRPFVVQAGEVRVTAVGTAFDIRTAPSGTVITVAEGRVKINSKDTRPAAKASQQARAVLAVAGQRLRYSEFGTTPTVSQIDPRLTDSWRAGILQFQEEPLQDVVSEVNRYSPRKIVIDGAGIGRTSFTGTIATDRVDNWLSALETMIPVTVEDRGEREIYIVNSASRSSGQ